MFLVPEISNLMGKLVFIAHLFQLYYVKCFFVVTCSRLLAVLAPTYVPFFPLSSLCSWSELQQLKTSSEKNLDVAQR